MVLNKHLVSKDNIHIMNMKAMPNLLECNFLKWQIIALSLVAILLVACGGAAQNESVQETDTQNDQSDVVTDVVIGDEDSPFNGVALDGDNPALPIVAQNDEGQTFDMHEFSGEYVLVNFGYTSCPDICPLTLATLAAAYKDLSELQQEKVNVVFVTLDPERDTPDRLNAYLEAFNQDFTGLYIPDKERLETVKAAYGIFSEIRNSESDESKNYFVDHTGGVFVVGPKGTFELFFPHDASADSIRSDLVILLEG